MEMAGVMDAVKGSSGRRRFEWKKHTLKFVHRPLALGLVHHLFFFASFHWKKIADAGARL